MFSHALRWTFSAFLLLWTKCMQEKEGNNTYTTSTTPRVDFSLHGTIVNP